MDLLDVGWQFARDGRGLRLLMRRRCHDHRLGRDPAIAGLQREPVRVSRNFVDHNARLDRRIEVPGPARHVGDEIIARHEAIRIVAIVGLPGQIDRPVRRHEAERVPALPPGTRNHTLVKDDMRQAGLRQEIADRQPRLAGANDDCSMIRRHQAAATGLFVKRSTSPRENFTTSTGGG